ncbi:hypothetical protein F3Y22_tig00112925pilonHSYRG00094 [Hibiscus syriacus]|uniref:Chromo domain-containing protein n=1 Tax=Hibiscus syriacus TaxID=106335 RepID=A0A6A2Y4R5_HIBSY|nr:hypothetical protein F3Y22_tig00112925pilonHSYRG00094 [Hibiscus syriacus]
MAENSNESTVAEGRGKKAVPTNPKKNIENPNESTFTEEQFGERLERVQHDFKTLEDHVLEQVDTLKGSAEETRNEVEARFVRLEDMIQALRESIEGMREDLTLCKRVAVSGGANITVSTPRVECPNPQGFNGTRDAKEVENYLWRVEQYFEGIDLNDEAAKVKTAALYLSDTAMLWWRRKHTDIERGACRLDTWDEFKKELKKYFYPENVVYEARKKLRELKQRGIIRDYVKEFTTLMLQIPNMSEDDLLFYFIDGLQGWAKQEIHRRDIRMVDEAIAIAESLIDFQPYSHTNATKNKDKYPAKCGGERRENNQGNRDRDHRRPQAKEGDRDRRPHPMSNYPKLGSLSAIVDRQDRESQAEMGSLQVLNALKAKSLTPTLSNGLMYVEAVINEKMTRAMVDTGATHNFVSIDEANHLGLKGIKKGAMTYLAMLKEDDEIEKTDDLPPIIHEVLEENKDVMPPELPNKLPPRREVDHKIELEPGAKPPALAPYRMAPPELEEFRRQLKELIDTGKIRPSKAPYGVPVLFQKKHDGSLRMCVDYRALNKFMVVYLDDIVVYSNCMEKYIDHLRIVFKILRENELYVKKEKCTFATEELHFLGHVIGHGKLLMDGNKIKAITEWEPPTKVSEMRPFEVHTDASDFAIGGVLMQEGHPIVFESRKLNDTERRYTVQENEMMAIIHCLRKKLSPKQARWQDFLAEFDYTLEYKPGKANVVSDALSQKAKLSAISLAKGTVLGRIKEGLEQDPMTRELVKLANDGKTQRFWVEEGLLYTKGRRIYVPKWNNLRRDFIKECHDTNAIPKFEGYGSIMVVVDRFSKYGNFIPCPKDCTAEEVARAFFKNVVKHWGLPRSIISDRDPRFTGRLWTKLFKLLGELNFSTSFHPQTDGQIERVNALLECYLRPGRSPFELATGQQPLIPHTLTIPPDEGKSPGATKMAKSWEENADIARTCLEKARKNMKKWADEKRRHREFSVRDLVLVKLLPQQFKALRSVHKGLIWRYKGLFQVLAKVGKVSYRLDLPSTLKIHPVFHVSMLKPYHADKEDPSRGYSHRAPPVVTKSYDKEVETVLTSRMVRKRGVSPHTEYLIKWKKLPESEATWELAEDLWQFEEHLKAYEATRTTSK